MRASASELVVDTVFGPTEPHSITLATGDWLTLRGGAGSGKSAVGLALCGVDPERVRSGVVSFPGGVLPHSAYIPTRPDLMFSGLSNSVIGEVGMFVPPGFDRLGEAARCIGLFGVSHLAGRSPLSLSGGERAKVALAAAAAQQPEVMLVDQVIDWIDTASREQVQSTLETMTSNGLSLVEAITDRRTAPAGQIVTMKDLRDSCVAQPSSCEYPLREVTFKASVERAGYGGTEFALKPFELAACSGETIAVTGPNGSGKTTLLKSLALLLPAQNGEISIETDLPPSSRYLSSRMRRREHEWATACLYSFQEPDDQLFCKTVREEIEFTAKVSGAPSAMDVDAIARRFGLEQVMDRSPLALPRGLRRAVLLASCFAANPPVLLLDEPTAELGKREYESLLGELDAYSRGGGISLLVSHDEEFIARVTNRRIRVREGQIDG